MNYCKRVINIEMNFIGAVLAFGLGAVISAVNYGLSRFVLRKRSDLLTVIQMVRQLLQIGYIIVLYLFGDQTPWDKLWLLVGGCLGMTVPSIWFTYRLVKSNDSSQGKEEGDNG